MSETRFTPGPWELRRKGGDRHIYMNGERPTESQMCDMTYYPWVPDNDADWELIAAAPDLYSVVDRFVEICDNAPPVEILKLIGDLVEPARATLAKARGEEQPR